MTYIVEIFLPLSDNDGKAFRQGLYEAQKAALVQKFGGMTAYSRAPAQGLWAADGKTSADAIIIFEVIVETLDRIWWTRYRKALETEFKQETILIRATASDLL